MRLLYWIYALVAFGLCAFLFLHVRRAESADPRALLEHARAAMSGPELDLLQAGHDLDAALAVAERAMDRPLVEEILIQRARLARQTNAMARAKADLEHVLAHHRPNSPAIESMLAAVLLDGGEVEGALARADGVIARDRNQPEAWGVRAEALLALANRHLAECSRRTGLLAAPAGLAQTEQLMRRIAARPLADVERLRLAQELYDLFPPSEKELAREIQSRLDDASALLAQVPEALAQSFRGGLRPKALTEYVRTLNDAGQGDAAADLGLAALSLGNFSTYAPLLRLMLDVLRENGRSAALPELIDPTLARRVALDRDFYEAWARALYELGNWPMVMVAGNQLRLIRTDETRELGSWYVALGLGKRQRYAEALPLLRKLAQGSGAEPFENALATAWLLIADATRGQGDPKDEATAIQRALAVATPRLPDQGAAWLRLAEVELASAQPNRGLALEALTQALRKLPQQRSQLEPRWRELGAQWARVRSIDFERERATLERENRLTPIEKRQSFEYVRLAELQYGEGHFASALALATRALDAHADLPPALDLASAAALELGAWNQAARWLRARADSEGGTPEVIAALAGLPEDVLGPTRRRDLVRLDPAGLGRRWAAEALRDRGQLAQAIQGLERIAPARRTDRDHLLLAELLYESNKLDAAQAQLARLSADVAVLAKAAPLMLSIAARRRDAAHATRILQLLEVKIELELDPFLNAVDELIIHGLFEVAAQACELLDGRQRWRSPRVHLRMAQIALLVQDHASAREALERAMAYDEFGSAELGLFIAAIEERRWGDCPDLLRELLASNFQAAPLQFVALAALGEQLDDARIVLEAEITQRRAEVNEGPNAPLPPIEALLSSALQSLSKPLDPKLDPITKEHGYGALPAGAVQRDPRTLLARVAALDDPEWTAWAVADLTRTSPPAKGTLWPTYLAARGADWLESRALTERLARSLTASWPTFAPAWDVLESTLLVALRAPDHPQMLELATARRAALASQGADPIASALLEARKLRAKGELDKAAAAVELAFQRAPGNAAVLAERGRIAHLAKRWATAIESHHRGLELAGASAEPEAIREFVAVLLDARRGQGVSLDALLRREFEFLLAQYPTDPWVRLEATRNAYPLGSAADRWAAEHALSELESLRARLSNGLDDVQPGASVRWADYYARLDPKRAFELVDSELVHAPHLAELWSTRGSIALTLGRLDEAVESLEISLAIAPTHAAARALVDCRARRGDAEAQLQTEVSRVAALVGLPQSDRDLQLALARALVRAERAKLTRGLATLAELWRTRDVEARENELIDIGLLYGVALCRRGAAGDGALALEVFSIVAPRLSDPMQQSLLATLRSLASALRARG